jgi:hypothetical protein
MKQMNTETKRLSVLIAAALMLIVPLDRAAAAVSVNRLTLRGGNTEDRAAYLRQPARFWGSSKYPDNTDFLGELVTLSNERMSFQLWCPGTRDPNKQAWTTGLGMPGPSKANWYANGFLDVVIDKVGLAKCPAAIDNVSGGEQGTLDMHWIHPEGTVRVRLTLLAGDDKLLVTVALETPGDSPAYRVELRCYPGSIQGGFAPDKLLRDRHAETAGRILERPEQQDNSGHLKAELTRDEPWILFYDKYFDPAEGRGEGPCALCYHPAEVSAATVSVENYACWARLDYPAGTDMSHLVLWDFCGVGNSDARRYMHALNVEVR